MTQWISDGSAVKLNPHVTGTVVAILSFFNMTEGTHSPLQPFIPLIVASVKHGLLPEVSVPILAKIEELANDIHPIDLFFATGGVVLSQTKPAIKLLISMFHGHSPLHLLGQLSIIAQCPAAWHATRASSHAGYVRTLPDPSGCVQS